MQKEVNPATEFSAVIAEHEAQPRRRYNEAGARARLNQALYGEDSRRLKVIEFARRQQHQQEVKSA